MLINFVITTYAILVVSEQCFGIHFLDLPGYNSEISLEQKDSKKTLNAGSDTRDVPKHHHKKHRDRKHFRRMRTYHKKPKMLDGKFVAATGDWKLRAQETETPETQMTTTENELDIMGSEISLVTQNIEPQNTDAEVQTVPEEILRFQEIYPPVKAPMKKDVGDERRHWLVRTKQEAAADIPPVNTDDKDATLKSKINMLVNQTVQDTQDKMKTVQDVKEKHKEKAPYKIGFIVSMVKKSRDVLNELFNVAVKHRDEWKALEQLKIFELIVHTNVDTTNLVRQLVEIHVQYLNSTAGSDDTTEAASGGRRVVLI